METSLNNKCRAFTSLEQSKKLAEILPFESADMYYALSEDKSTNMINFGKPQGFFDKIQVAWSLASLLKVLPEINDISLKMEKVKAKDGYDGYYYPIEYEGIVLIPYSKNPIDACYEMILRLHERKIL